MKEQKHPSPRPQPKQIHHCEATNQKPGPRTFRGKYPQHTQQRMRLPLSQVINLLICQHQQLNEGWNHALRQILKPLHPLMYLQGSLLWSHLWILRRQQLWSPFRQKVFLIKIGFEVLGESSTPWPYHICLSQVQDDSDTQITIYSIEH